MRLCGVYWCVDDDGAPDPTKQGNIGDTSDFNRSPDVLQSKLSRDPQMHNCLGEIKWVSQIR